MPRPGERNVCAWLVESSFESVVKRAYVTAYNVMMRGTFA